MTDEVVKALKRIAECLSFISLWLFLILMSGCMGCFTVTTKGAEITLAVDQPTGPVNEHRVYVGTAPNSYFTFHTFPKTNRFVISVTNNKVFLACSALNSAGESDLSEEINVQIFGGWVQLAPSPQGPWTNYQSLTVPIEIKEPARFVRVRLGVE